MRRWYLRALWLAVLLLLGACGSNKNEQDSSPRRVFGTNTPLPTLTPGVTASPIASAVALTNNFARVDGAIRIQYPDGWVVDTAGDAATGQIVLGNNRAVQRGTLTQPADLSMQLIWSPAPALARTRLPEDVEPSALLAAIVDEYAPDIDFGRIVTQTIGNYAVARVEGRSDDGVNTVLYIVDFGAGVAGYYTFKTRGAVADFVSLMEALIEATRYGGPPAFVAGQRDLIPPLLTLQHEEAVTGAVWLDDNRLLSWSADGTVRVWDGTTGENVMILKEAAPVNIVRLSRDHTRVAVLAEGQAFHLWEVSSGELLRSLEVLGALEGFVWSPDERLVAGLNINYASNLSTVPIWEVATGDLLVTLRPGVRTVVTDASWDSSSTRLIIVGSGAQATVWDVTTRRQVMTVSHADAVFGAVWRADDSQLMTWSQDSTVRVWEVASGQLKFRLQHAQSPPRGAVWSPEGTRILTWQQDRVGRVWDGQSGEQLFTFENPPSLGGAAWNATATRIISWARDVSSTWLVRLWDGATGQQLLSLPGQSVTGIEALDNDESRLLTWSREGVVMVWDTQTARAILRLEHGGVEGARWSPDYRRVVSWSSDGTLRLWDATPTVTEAQPAS